MYTDFRAQVHRPRRQKEHPVCFHYFTKAQFVLLGVHTDKCLSVFTDVKDVLLLSV